jgi:hypothetical protein
MIATSATSQNYSEFLKTLYVGCFCLIMFQRILKVGMACTRVIFFRFDSHTLMATIFTNQCLKKQLKCGDSLAQDQKIWQLSSKFWKILIENWQLFSKIKEYCNYGGDHP